MASNDPQTAKAKPEEVQAPGVDNRPIFPYPSETQRLSNYQYFEQLFLGEHYDAFNMRISSGEYSKAYSKLRYVMVNFAGLISKVVADMLFSEPVTLKMNDKKTQSFVQGLWDQNHLDIQLYESALSNSYFGDALFKVRTGKRHPNHSDKTVIIEDTTPRVYFPKIDGFNVRAEPLQKELAWVFNSGKQKYLRKEIHEPGKIINEVYRMDNQRVAEQVGLDILGIPGLTPEVDTKIDESLVVHIPNWKVGSRWSGISDYYDLDSLFFALNNRMTKVDNVLDKHTDPILMVPPGVLDEKGKVRKQALGVIEIGEGETGRPEYVVWDASLENAFKQIEKIVEFMQMIGEISPDILGMGKGGAAESGRALKYKLLRTIAKVSRKKLYYYVGLRETLYVAQLVAKEYGLEVNGQKMTGEPERPDLVFADGIPMDTSEVIETEQMAVDGGFTSTKDSIMRIYDVDEETAKKRVEEIKKEKAINLPNMNLGGNNPFSKGNAGNNGDDPKNGNNPGKPGDNGKTS